MNKHYNEPILKATDIKKKTYQKQLIMEWKNIKRENIVINRNSD